VVSLVKTMFIVPTTEVVTLPELNGTAPK